MAELGLTSEELVQACNKIIVYAGLIAKVANLEEVRTICSSSPLLVAALEGFLGRRLEGVVRKPKTPEQRAYNLSIVVDVLSQLLSCDLSHISGERIVEGSLEDIANILELLAVVCHGKPLQGPPSVSAAASPEAQPRGSSAPSPRQVRDPADGSRSSQPRSSSETGDISDRDRSPRGDASDHTSQRSNEDVQRVRWRPQQQEQQERSSDEAGPRSGRAHDAGGSPLQGAARVRRKAGSRRQRISLRRVVMAGQLPLSPIQELSREGWETSRATKGTSSLWVQRPGPSVRAPDAGIRPMSSPRSAGMDFSTVRRSAGGVSSVISVPSVTQDDPGRITATTAITTFSDPHSSGNSTPRQRALLPQRQRSESSSIAADEATSSPSPSLPQPQPQLAHSEGTTTLLGQALSQAEATLRAMGRQYQELYYNEDEDAIADAIRAARSRRRVRKARRQQPPQTDAAGRRIGSLSSEPPASEHGQRVPRAAPWLDGQPSLGGDSAASRHRAFLRRAQQELTDGVSTNPDSIGLPPTSASLSGSRSASRRPPRVHARPPGGPEQRAAPDGAAGGQGVRGVRAGGAGTEHAALVRALREGGAAAAAATNAAGNGRRLMVPRVPRAPYGLEDLYVGEEQLGASEALASLAAKPRAVMQLNPDLEAKLRHLHRLANGDPKQRAAREAVQSMAVADDLQRTALRRALVDRLSSARARRQAALRGKADRLREQGREYQKRVEQLRLQRLATEWSTSQRSVQMRRALQAELAVRDAFLEVLEAEKEVLLAERQDAKADTQAAFPMYKRALSKAERDYGEIFSLLQEMLALEKQQRFRADREAEQAQRHYTQLAATVVEDRVQELLARVARDEEAARQRRSIATQPRAKRALVARIRRLLGLT